MSSMMTDMSRRPNVPSRTQIAHRLSVTPPPSRSSDAGVAKYRLISDSMPATRFIQPLNSALTAARRLCPTSPMASSPKSDSSVPTNVCSDLYSRPGSARAYNRDITGAGSVEGRARDFSWRGKCVEGRPRRR